MIGENEQDQHSHPQSDNRNMFGNYQCILLRNI